MYVYAYIVHFEPTRGEGGHPITIGGGRPITIGGGPENCYRRLELAIKQTVPCVYMCMYVCIYIYVCVCIYIYIYIYIRIK